MNYGILGENVNNSNHTTNSEVSAKSILLAIGLSMVGYFLWCFLLSTIFQRIRSLSCEYWWAYVPIANVYILTTKVCQFKPLYFVVMSVMFLLTGGIVGYLMFVCVLMRLGQLFNYRNCCFNFWLLGIFSPVGMAVIAFDRHCEYGPDSYYNHAVLPPVDDNMLLVGEYTTKRPYIPLREQEQYLRYWRSQQPPTPQTTTTTTTQKNAFFNNNGAHAVQRTIITNEGLITTPETTTTTTTKMINNSIETPPPPPLSSANEETVHHLSRIESVFISESNPFEIPTPLPWSVEHDVITPEPSRLPPLPVSKSSIHRYLKDGGKEGSRSCADNQENQTIIDIFEQRSEIEENQKESDEETDGGL